MPVSLNLKLTPTMDGVVVSNTIWALWLPVLSLFAGQSSD